MKQYEKKIHRYICCVCLVVIILFQNTIPVSADFKVRTGADNTSNVIYKWTKVRSKQELAAILEKNKEYRLMLMNKGDYLYHTPNGVYWCRGTYGLMTLTKDGEGFNKVPVSDVAFIAKEADQFYSRGGFNTPYMVYTGENDNSDYGGGAPRCKLYLSDYDDSRLNSIIAGAAEDWLIVNDNYYVKDLEGNYWSNDDHDYRSATWTLVFPATNVKNISGYNNCYQTQIGLFSDYEGVNDDVNWVVSNSVEPETIPLVPGENEDSSNVNCYSEIGLFDCYIGEKVTDKPIEGTMMINSGQTAAISGENYVKDGTVIRVKKGGTLFISGTLIMNGMLSVEGGTVVVQAGALLISADPTTYCFGNITVDGGRLLVRKGARIISGATTQAFFLQNGASLVNAGTIAIRDKIQLTNNSCLINKQEGVLLLSTEIKPWKYPREGYRAHMKVDGDAYVEQAQKEYVDYLRLFYVNGNMIKDYTSKFKNEGICHVVF